MNSFTYISVFLYGLAIGSFLNVLIVRLPDGKKFAFERSVCPQCSSQLKWYHNIPLLSFLFLRGKCAFCRKAISLRYPLVELLNAVVYLYFYHQYGYSYAFGAFALLASALLVIFFIDYDHQIIPDSITLPGMIVGLLFSLTPDGVGIIGGIVGLLVGGGTLYFMAMLGDWLFKKESMGGGDIKMAAMLGAFLGWQKVILIFMSSALIGLIVSIALLAISSKLRETRTIPFGPFLAIAAFVAVTYGDELITCYLSYVGLR